MNTTSWRTLWVGAFVSWVLPLGLVGQTLINIDFGVGVESAKTGFAATGMGTNDYWNLYRHYEPRFAPGMAMVHDGKLEKLRFADRGESAVSVTVSNAPGVWGNSSGDAMYDSYVFAQNGSNIVVTVIGLAPGRYHFYLYGHAEPDVTGEQNPLFALVSGTNVFGPVSPTGGAWRTGQPWQERAHYVVFRDVLVEAQPVRIDAAPGPNGVAVLNGLQIISRGTSPPRLLAAGQGPGAPVHTNLMFREIHYEGAVSDSEARFAVNLTVESLATNEISAPLFEGDVALVSPELPEALRIINQGRQTRLYCTQPGSYPVKLQLLAKITKSEPWNQVGFTGPAAPIATVSAKADASGVEMQLLSGTQLDPEKKANSRVRGFLGSDRVLSLRWQSQAAEVTRKSLVTVETTAVAQITPTVVKFSTDLRYEVLQAAIPRLTIALPASHALTRIQGEQIRDWQVKPDGENQVLTVEFIRPVEKACAITVFSEMAIERTPVTAMLVPPQPLEVERESGSFTLSADDATVELKSAPGLRQVNAPSGALAAYRFNARPLSLEARLQRIEPVLRLADRITVRMEETRLLVAHALNLTVEKAGIYSLDCTPQPGFVVSDVKGEGIDDWKAAGSKLKISFGARVLGARKIDVQLEQAHRDFPEQITVLPLTLAGGTNVTTQLGAASSPGIRLKTARVSDMREVPVSTLAGRQDELLAFASEQTAWLLELAAEKLPARVVAEVFNLITIGDGLVGGSATVRYGIINQGVQQFRVAVPLHWKNVEFIGSNIRRKEQQTNVWTITLQDKAWGGYTLVLTYDYQFDPKGSTLDLAGAHPLEVERETGSLGLMTAANLKLTPAAPSEPLRRVDESELSESDRALCTRPLLLAYRYTGSSYRHTVEITRFEELPVLDAVADRIELTTVLTEEGQLLTQSSFMVKNNEKQFQKFKLPRNSEFWSSYVNGQPAKPERDGDWLLVPLPRDVNRDQAFAVDIVHAQKVDLKTSLFPRRVELAAPLTDIPNTYAEWQLFVPVSQRLSGFRGNMTVARGTTYDLRDAWEEFVQFYGVLIERHGGKIMFGFVLGLVTVLIGVALRRGFRGAVTVVVLFGILAILAGMMLPALSRAKSKAQRISAMNNLKQVGLAARVWSTDNGEMLPPNFEAMKNELGTDKVTIDPNTGQPFVYVGAGKDASHPEAILAYSPSDLNGRAVLFADGSVQVMNAEKFQEALQRDAAVPRAVISANLPAPALQLAEGVSSLGRAQQAESAARQDAQQLYLSSQSAGVAIAAVTNAPVAQPHASTAGSFLTRGAFGGAPGVAPTKATATGVRPIRIDVPRTGQAFSFTKVLNAGQEPLTVNVSMVRLKVYRGFQMFVQVCAFLLGLGILGWLALQAERRSLWMAFAVALIIWSIARLLIMWRLLHLGLIAAVPALVLALVAWAAYRFWQRRNAARAASAAEAQSGDDATSSTPPFLPVIIAFLAFSFSALSAGAQEVPAASNTVSVVSASYTGVVRDKVAQFDARIDVAAAATNQVVRLFGEDVAIESFAAPDEIKLLREGGSVAALLPARGKVSLRFKLIAKLGGDVTRRQLSLAIPPALGSQVSLLIDEAEADVEFPSAIAFGRTSTNQQTRVEAVLGPASRLELTWTPRVKRAAEIAATVFAQNNVLVTFGGGVVNTRAVLDYQVSQGELKQLRLAIPAGHRLLRVEGDAIRVWELKDDILAVDLLKGVSPAYKLSLETERVLDALPSVARVEIPKALDVKRETGLVAVRGSEELSLVIQDASELQRVDVEEFHRAMPDRKDGLVGAFRFLKTDFTLGVRAEPVQAQIDAVERETVRISSEAIRLETQVDYTIKRAGVFALRLGLPADFRIEGVAGTNIAQWVERKEEGGRMLEVTLKERTIGAYALGVKMAGNYTEPPPTLPIAGVHPTGLQKLSGFITIVTEPGVGAKTALFEGLTEIPFASVSSERAIGGGSALAYKFIDSTPGPAASWKLSVLTEAVEPWVRAEVANVITLTETMVNGRSLVKYDVANAPAREFRVRVPAAFRNVEISGAQIRRRDHTNGEWRVELQGKVRGDYRLTVTWELPRLSSTNLVDLPGIEVLGVERESGYLALVARPPLQVSQHSVGELLNPIDARELPDWAGRPDAATVLAYRYVRPGYLLTVAARRFDEAEVLQALIDSARLATVIADDGQMMTEVTLAIRNNGRQHLEVELPAGATVWSAFVAGQPVRPGKREGKLLLPLARDIASDAPVAIELTFLNTGSFPRRQGAVALASPRFDVPLKNARWDLYLPPDYDYSDFQGTMNRTSDAAAPMVQVYSLSEYNVQQKAQEEQKLAGLKSELSEAKKSIADSNLRQALSSYNRAKTKGQQYQEVTVGDKDLKEVEQVLRRAQSSNLINAQNDFFIGNYGRLDDLSSQVQAPAQQRQLYLNADVEIAGQQWDKLEKAQQVAVAKVAPLRVNLPTRGVHFSFAQVLQTELRKPMTIRLQAENTRVPSWITRIGLSAAGFGVLWILMAILNRRWKNQP